MVVHIVEISGDSIDSSSSFSDSELLISDPNTSPNFADGGDMDGVTGVLGFASTCYNSRGGNFICTTCIIHCVTTFFCLLHWISHVWRRCLLCRLLLLLHCRCLGHLSSSFVSLTVFIRPTCRDVLWFSVGVCLSVRLSTKLVNTIQTEPFQLGPSNVVHILLMTRGRTLLIFKVIGQRSRSHATPPWGPGG